MAGVGTAYPADYSTTYSGPLYTAQQGRTAFSAAMAGASAARPLGGISGVRPGTPSTIGTATSTTWTVTSFGGYIDLETSASNGGYFFSFLTTSTGAVTAAAGSARVDLLYVQIADTNTGDSTTVAPRVILDYQAGVAGAGIPALTAARAFVIAQINVPASGSPTVTWVAPYCAAAGGIIPVSSSTQYPASPSVSQQVDNVALGGPLRWNGSNWLQPNRVHAEYTYSVSAANSAVVSVGTPVLDTANSSPGAASYFTPVAGGFTVIPAADIAFTATMAIGTLTTGRSFMQGGIGTTLVRNGIQPNEDTGSVTAASIRSAAASGALQFLVFQITGGTRTVTGRIHIDYLGPVV